MCAKPSVAIMIGALVFLAMHSPARADLPNDQVVQYSIRETPANPESDVTFVIQMELTAVEQDGDEIAWEISKLKLTRTGQGGSPDTAWVDYAAVPDTLDGYWWVEHADPMNPEESEFDLPPLLQGTAAAIDPYDDDLEYSIQGDYCDSDCQRLFGGSVAALDFVLILEGEEEPEEEGEDEPAEIPEGVNLPG